MNKITFFTRPDCSLCRGAWYVIQRVRKRIPFDLESINISLSEHKSWFDAYRNDIPVVHLNGEEIFRHRVDEGRLRELLGRLNKPGCGLAPSRRDVKTENK